MVDSDAVRIEKAIRQVQESGDESDLIDVLLQDALNWPLADEDDENIEIDDISYSWDDVLVEMGFSSADAPIELRQVMPFPNWPHGIFIVKFGSSKFFTQGRGMTGPLRTILRQLMEKVRPTTNHPSWKKDHLLFLCHNETEYFQFARFEDPKDDSKASKLHMFGWGPNDHIRTVCEYNLLNLCYVEGMNEEEAYEAVAAAFDVSKVSNKFYEDYKKEFDIVKPIIAKHSSITDEKEIHQTTLTLFNRILFLRFIEKKGWLHFGETNDYLRELFNAGGVGSSTFYSSRLKRLFFEGLAIEGKQNDSAYGEVAFLNGGLFEESKFDIAINDLPDEMFNPLLGEDGLFYKYNFTVQESTPLDIDVAIDPEMIGTMFEELVTDRNDKGAFYTPRVVVSYMCREAIKSVLEERTEVDVEAIRKLVDDDDNEGLTIDDARTINSVLAEVKAIDPACGSGAYLLGLLHELVRVHTKLSTTAEDLTESRHEMKLRIISRSIYGVDLEPFATNIAMLRLWLSLSVEAPEPLPLPNLDFNIETGDSLQAPDPQSYQMSLLNLDLIQRADALSQRKEEYLMATGENARELRIEIKAEEAEIRKLLRKQNDAVGSVDFRVHFASVFTKNGGFDIVLANPPYVRQEGIPKEDKKKLLALYGSGNYPNYPPVKGRSDLYCYFFVRAHQLLRNDGIHVFICSNSWLDVEFGVGLQHFILKNSQIIRFIDSSVERQFLSAAINTTISLIKKKKPENNNCEFLLLNDKFAISIQDRTKCNSKTIKQKNLLQIGMDKSRKYTGSKWSNQFNAPEIYWKLLDQCNDFFVPLEELVDIRRGITSGNNSFFFLNDEEAGSLQIEDEFLYPVLVSPQQTNDYLLNPIDLETRYFYCDKVKHSIGTTNALSYINEGENQDYHLATTVVKRKLWYKGREVTMPHMCLATTMNKMPKFIVCEQKVVLSDNFAELEIKPDYLHCKDIITGILQSTLVSLFIELGGRKPYGGGAMKIQMYEIANIPIIKPDLIKQLEPLNRKRLEFEMEMISEDRIKLDEIIFDALELDREERKELVQAYKKLVNNRTKKSSQISS